MTLRLLFAADNQALIHLVDSVIDTRLVALTTFIQAHTFSYTAPKMWTATNQEAPKFEQ